MLRTTLPLRAASCSACRRKCRECHRRCAQRGEKNQLRPRLDDRELPVAFHVIGCHDVACGSASRECLRTDTVAATTMDGKLRWRVCAEIIAKAPVPKDSLLGCVVRGVAGVTGTAASRIGFELRPGTVLTAPRSREDDLLNPTAKGNRRQPSLRTGDS